MKKYLTKRLIHSIFLIWLVATVVWIAMRMLPGGPEVAILGEHPTQDEIQALRTQLGLDRPLYVQYFEWFYQMLTLDFGRSFATGERITVLLNRALAQTLSIAWLGGVIGLLIAIPSGVISATRRNSWLDYGATLFAFLGLSIPAFYLGVLLALVFGVWADLLPVFGYASLTEEGVVAWFKSILLPGIAVGTAYAAVIMRMMRSSLLEVKNQEYMTTAKAKGVAPRVRLYKHAMQNALIPVVTISGIQIATLITGSVTVELVFAYNGLGRLLVSSIFNNDYPVLQYAIMVVAAILIGANLVVDMIYTMIDPRIRYEE